MFTVTLLTDPNTKTLTHRMVENLRSAWGGDQTRWLSPLEAAEFSMERLPNIGILAMRRAIGDTHKDGSECSQIGLGPICTCQLHPWFIFAELLPNNGVLAIRLVVSWY